MGNIRTSHQRQLGTAQSISEASSEHRGYKRFDDAKDEHQIAPLHLNAVFPLRRFFKDPERVLSNHYREVTNLKFLLKSN
jgi:hypothetical protein